MHSRLGEEGQTMMEFRWVVFLVLWTLLIGPVLDFTQHTNSAQLPRAKQIQSTKVQGR